jgi:hypothetical protein
VSIVRQGLSEDGKFADGYDAIFGKKKAEAKPAAAPAAKKPAVRKPAKKPAAKKK